MSSIICLAGLSNTGKSTSIKYLDPQSTFIISCTNKQLQIPGFRKKYSKVTINEGKLEGNWFVSNDYNKINTIMTSVSKFRPEITTIVVDDANYLLSNEIFQNVSTKGYDKFAIMAKNYYDLIQTCQNLRDDLNVVFITHVENYGTEMDPLYRMWTSGKMLTNQINLDGLFSYIIYSERITDDVSGDIIYRFKTRTDGNDTCRTVQGCFEDKYIEPNLKLVVDTINNFEFGEE